MQLIKSSVERIQESNPFKLVERVGRICYKSTDKITDNSYIKFCNRLAENQHFAMLEHGTVTFLVQGLVDLPEDMHNIPYIVIDKITNESVTNPSFLVTVSLSHMIHSPVMSPALSHMCYTLIAEFSRMTAARYLNSNQNATEITNSTLVQDVLGINITIVEDLAKVPHITEAIMLRHNFVTIKFICDRGVSHELVRHRCAVAQESTRYCNYSQAKFGNQVTFVSPSDFDNWTASQQDHFKEYLASAEAEYLRMITAGFLPENSRRVLPHALKTEVVLTMSCKQWNHFFDIRYIGTTGKPHPDAQAVAKAAYDVVVEAFPSIY